MCFLMFYLSPMISALVHADPASSCVGGGSTGTDFEQSKAFWTVVKVRPLSGSDRYVSMTSERHERQQRRNSPERRDNAVREPKA